MKRIIICRHCSTDCVCYSPLAARSRSNAQLAYAASLPSLSELLEVRYVDGSLPYGEQDAQSRGLVPHRNNQDTNHRRSIDHEAHSSDNSDSRHCRSALRARRAVRLRHRFYDPYASAHAIEQISQGQQIFSTP